MSVTFDSIMYDLTRPDYEPISTQKDLNDFVTKIQFKTHYGDYIPGRVGMNNMMGAGQRIGQAFMNVLDPADYEKLTGTLIDPFHKSLLRDVLIALDYLIFSE